MIDLHCHPLWGVDDGAETFEVARDMCKMAADDGITHLVATPHCNYAYKFRPEVNRQRLQELQEAVGESPTLLLGCDFNLSYDNIRQVVQDHVDYTINGTSYLLVEFAHEFNPGQFEQVLYEIQLAGLTPILTHPERNAVFQRKADLLYHWVSRGCLVQVTAQSYVGGFGSTSLRACEEWLERNLIHFFATDAHDLEHRPPRLSPCHRKLEETHGKELAELLLRKNPEAVLKGEPLPDGPRPVGPEEVRPRKRSWLSFLTGRK